MSCLNFYYLLPRLGESSDGDQKAESTSETTEYSCGYQVGYKAGYEEAGRAAQIGYEKKKAANDKVADEIKDKITNFCGLCDENLNKMRDQLVTRASEILFKTLNQFFPLLKKKFGLENVVSFLNKYASAIKTNVVVEVHEDMTDQIKMLLCQEEAISYSINRCDSKLMNVIDVVPSPELEFGEARIRFKECGVERILTDYQEALKQMINQEMQITSALSCDALSTTF